MKNGIAFIFLLIAATSHAQKTIPRGFNNTGTMFNRSKAYTKYVLIDPQQTDNAIKIHKVTLERSLYTNPQTDLFIEVFNIFFESKKLAVFSVMPSLFHNTPQWQKISMDSIKSYIDLKGLDSLMKNQFNANSDNDRGLHKRYVDLNYSLILKKADGYYCNTTDCVTEFFTVINDPEKECSKYFVINTKAKMLSIAEYESDYMRKHTGPSGNNLSDYGSDTPDAQNGSRRYLSYTDSKKNEYKFWLLDYWASDSRNPQRGMDRFIFNPDIGIVAAAYEFYMPQLEAYYSTVKDLPAKIEKKDFGIVYKTTPYFFNNSPSLLRYLTEDVIKASKIEKLN